MRVEEFEVPGALGQVRGRVSGQEQAVRGAIVCLHGQPNGDLGGNEGFFDELAELAVPLGYAVVQFSFGGAEPSDGRPEDITLASQLADFEAVLTYIRSDLAPLIHIVGESAGATIAALAWQPDAASYLMLWPAFDLADTDLKPFLEEERRRKARVDGKLVDGDIVIGSDFLEEIATTNFERCFDLPAVDMLIAHGRVDQEVPYAQSLRAIPNARHKLLFASHPDADHGFKNRDQREWLKQHITTWLKAY